jgi:hypothetical protein
MTARPVALLVALWCALHAGRASAQPARLSLDQVPGGAIEPEPPAIELVTFGVGGLIFEKWGHAALCLRYHRPEHPAVCFNYGVTDFSGGAAMVWRFMRSRQRFWVEPMSYASMYGFYEWEDRDIWIQTLPVTGAQARAIEAKLWSDIQEANRYYVYDHFLDNCTTRLRDIIDQATGGALRTGSEVRSPLSFRELGRRGLAEMPPLLLLSDVVTGRQLDERPTAWQAMFLPELLRRHVEVAMGAAPRLVYQRQGPAFPVDGPSWRLELLGAGLALALLLALARWRQRLETQAVAAVAVELVVLGAIVWSVAIASSIDAVRYNEALLVVTPLDAVLPFLAGARRRRYALVRVGLLALVSLLAAIGVFHQPLWILILVVFAPMAVFAFDLPHGWRGQRDVAITGV